MMAKEALEGTGEISNEGLFPVPKPVPLPSHLELSQQQEGSDGGNHLQEEFSGSALEGLERLGVKLLSSDTVERDVVQKAMRGAKRSPEAAKLGFGSVVASLLPSFSLSAVRHALSVTREEQRMREPPGQKSREEGLRRWKREREKLKLKENILLLLESALLTAKSTENDEERVGEEEDKQGETTIGGLSLEETERERKIRLGLITPFDRIQGLDKTTAAPQPRRSMMYYKLGKDLENAEGQLDEDGTIVEERERRKTTKRKRKRKAEERRGRKKKKKEKKTNEGSKNDENGASRCPVCGNAFPSSTSNITINRHIDRCLTRPRSTQLSTAHEEQKTRAAEREELTSADSSEEEKDGSTSSFSSSAESSSSEEEGLGTEGREKVQTQLGGQSQRNLQRLKHLHDKEKKLKRLRKTSSRERTRGGIEETERGVDEEELEESSTSVSPTRPIHSTVDDGDSDAYRERQERFRTFERRYIDRLRARRLREQQREEGEEQDMAEEEVVEDEEEEEEQEERGLTALEDHDPDEYFDQEEIILDGGLRIPNFIYRKLYAYQRVGIKWLWELFSQRAGGIVGDEMGLGKTVQVAAYLASLAHSNRLQTTLIAAPASVLGHWVRELHRWYPLFRVLLLHSSGSVGSSLSRTEVVNKVSRDGGILITTYEGVRINKEILLNVKWDYVILDEGHKIRNPDADITLVCKRFQTVNRLILTGSPIQNNLRELWSLFDFAFPGRLGVLPTFEAELALPIRLGGYANASPMQVQMAYKCALILRDLISPYLLRRMKADVQHIAKLPPKTEQVLFCRLTPEQKAEYKSFLSSKEVTDVLERKVHAFRAITILRKICNHPDLMHEVMQRLPNGKIYKGTSLTRPDDYGYWQKAGKLLVVDQILPLWKEQGHRVLFFTQTRQMLDIIQQYVQERGWKFARLDGNSSIKSRQPLIDRFNSDPSIFLFLLTTRAGGLGVNLTGANRVLLYDPDWNPSTDSQARERAWRLGQQRSVTIYRLITSGTIEEKIYHRQIYKQFLTNKILKDPKQRRFFKTRDLRDLFTYTEDEEKNKTEESLNETTDLFPAGRIDFARDREREKREREEKESKGKRRRKRYTMANERSSEESSEEQPEETEKKDNQAILEALINGKDLQGAFRHNIVEKGGGLGGERQIMENEASSIAKKALESLKRSTLAVRRSTATFAPTWTGSHGEAGAPRQQQPPKPRFGRTSNAFHAKLPSPAATAASGSRPPSVSAGLGKSASEIGGNDGEGSTKPLDSRSLLQRIRQRQEQGTVPSQRVGLNLLANEDQEHAQDRGAVAEKRHIELLEALHSAFIGAGERGLSSAEVIEEFGERVGQQDKLVFRQMLRELASIKGGVWFLKPEFQ